MTEDIVIFVFYKCAEDRKENICGNKEVVRKFFFFFFDFNL